MRLPLNAASVARKVSAFHVRCAPRQKNRIDNRRAKACPGSSMNFHDNVDASTVKTTANGSAKL
jgi:hypothetical protein